jgi:hypothetical protein
MKSDPGYWIEDFGKVAPKNNVSIEEEAEKGGNLGFSKLARRPVPRGINENSGEKERVFGRFSHVMSNRTMVESGEKSNLSRSASPSRLLE